MKRFITNHRFLITLIAAAVIASSLSLYIGLQQSIWFDEAYSILLAQHSWTEIVRLTAADVHPPFYYWLLKAWMGLFGSGELAVRSLSILFLGLSIGTAGLLLRKLFGARVALLALPFLVFAPFLLRYGFEVRMYALCSFIGIAATYLLLLAAEEKEKRKRRLLFLGYGLLVAVSMYTLYFMALVWIAHLAWLVWQARREHQKDTLLHATSAYAFAFLLFLPWLPVFLGKADGGTLSAVTNQLNAENLYGMVTYLFLYRPPWAVNGIATLAVVGIVAAIIYLIFAGYKQATAAERTSVTLFLMYFFVPVVVLIVVTRFLPIYIERYTAHIAIGLYSVIGVLVALALKGKKRLVYGVAVFMFIVQISGVMSLANLGNYNFQRVHTPAVKEIASLLDSCRSGAVVFADDPQTAMEFMYYVTDCPVYFFNETLEMGGGFAMLSGSSLRVGDVNELPATNEILHVYYNKPRRGMPVGFEARETVTIGALSVTTHRSL